MRSAAKQYAPVGPCEKATGICPLYVAWVVTDELQHYFRVTLPESLSAELAARAERVWAGRYNTSWRRKIQGPHGRDWMRAFMRHWLAALLHKNRPDLFEELPDSYKVGHPLPLQYIPKWTCSTGKPARAARHGQGTLREKVRRARRGDRPVGP